MTAYVESRIRENEILVILDVLLCSFEFKQGMQLKIYGFSEDTKLVMCDDIGNQGGQKI